MRTAIYGARVLVLALVGTLALAGCGRKNLPEAPRQNRAVGAAGANDDANNPVNLQNFQRSNRVTSSGGDDLRITPAEVANNPGASKRRFLLDGLLN